MGSFWDSIKDQAESLGGVMSAPAGVVYDLASVPFNDEDDSLGTVATNLAKRGTQMLDPIINPDTASGAVVGGAMDAANWVMREGISEPISAMTTMGSHQAATGDWGTLFSGEDWGHAYEIAQKENAGQALAHLFLHDSDVDPFDYEDPYEQKTYPEHTVLAPTISWGANIAGSFALDPFAVAGKGLGMANQAAKYGKLSQGQRAELSGLLAETGTGKADRLTKWADWTAGQNQLGRPLTGPEILQASPELRKWAAEPHVIAGLVADANKLDNPATRRNAVRRIVAVAGGDANALTRLKAEVTELPHIADALKNMRRGNVLDLKKIANDPTIAQNPQFIQHLEGQIGRLNSDGAIDKMMDSWSARLDQMAGTAQTLNHIPAVHASGRRALNQLNDRGITRLPKKAHDALETKALAKVDEWSAKRLARAEGAGLLFQKGLTTVPVLAIKTAGMMASPYTRLLPNVNDALRQTQFTGVAKLDSWGDATSQLDSMLKISHVAPDARMTLLSKAYLAKNEPEKLNLIHEAERLSMRSMAKHYSSRAGHDIDSEYIEELMITHANKRGATLQHLYGRSYAATSMPEEMAGKVMDRAAATRAKGTAAIEDAATKAASRESFTPVADDAKWQLRVDHVADEDGMPVALPLLSSQLTNAVPLIDMGLAKKLLKQDTSFLSRTSKAWRAEKDELDALIDKHRTGKIVGAAAVGLEKSIKAKRQAMDLTMLAGQKSLRVWKMSVLLRLGYPARVVLDDHWRIWSQIGAGTFYGSNAPEAIRNVGFNSLGGRARMGRQEYRRARLEAEGLRDELRSDRLTNYPVRLAEHKKAQRSAAAHRGQITKLRNQGGDVEERIAHHEKMIAEADAQSLYLQEQLGEVSPDDILMQLDVLHKVLKEGPKALRPDKRHIGLAPVDIGDGYTAPGAFSGVGGGISRVTSSSRETFEYQQKGVEDSVYGRAHNGAHRTIANDEPGHLAAWADVLNNQIRNSPEAMHFVKGGTVEDFVTWVKAPEQAELRRRLPHYAHDPEEWGERIESLVHDYIPNAETAERVLGPGVTQKWLAKTHPEALARPHVHGMVASDTVGTSDRSLGVGRQLNRVFSFLADKPTDLLSRHPYFNAMYKMHVKDMAEVRRLSYAKSGQRFGQNDIDDIAHQARKLALADVKRTLFDISAHSHAAHVMRFISPFFAAHQEVLSRWWRIVGENPAVVRRFQQAFDAPRHAGLVVDENGDPVKPGDAVSFQHSLMLPLPKAFGGNQKWSISENSFNLVLQGGLSNPGAGPLVTVPLEYLSQKYAETEEIARVARIFNPFPPNSPGEAAMPATLKRALAVGYGMGINPMNMNGIGMREYNEAYSRNIQDLTVDFQLKYGREPSKGETDTLMKRAGRETNVDMVLRLANNVASPFPARPNSKYNVVQQGWWQIREQGRAQFPTDTEAAYEWSYRQFKEKYGEAYMALTYSNSNNAAGLDGSPAEVAAYKRYKGIIGTVDPHLTRAVMGASLDKSGLSQERTPEGKNYFVDTSTRPGSSEKFFSTDEPAQAMEEQMARRGWQKYGELTGAITAQAQQMGLTSYTESDQLVALRKAGLDRLKEENWAFRADIEDFDSGQYDAYVDDMRKIVASPSLVNDPEREDVRVLASYLRLRDYFSNLIDQRQAAGLGGLDAAATQPILGIYTKLVGGLVEQNTYFEENMYNGLVERDPLLVGN
jgi:hypothetical protein